MQQFFKDDLGCINFNAELKGATALYILAESELDSWVESRADSAKQAAWCKANSFVAGKGQVLAVADDAGALQCLLLGSGDAGVVDFSSIWQQMPAGKYFFASNDASVAGSVKDNILINV